MEEEIGFTRQRLERSASSAQEKAGLAITEQQYRRLLERRSGLLARRQRLELRAPFDGRVAHVEQLHAGVWIGVEMPLLSLVVPGNCSWKGIWASSTSSW
ncbi:hypothetical protein MBH78_17490 [Oceanimonas sp. NS1]|nr:hypothetical protein [Oceanimonas sp. NS1]